MKNILFLALFYISAIPLNVYSQIIDTPSSSRTGFNKSSLTMNQTGIIADKNYTPEQLVNDLFVGGGCFEISNVEYNGGPNAIGAFAQGNSSIGISSGIVLSTGDVANISGPNISEETGSSVDSEPDSYPDLEVLEPGFLIHDVVELKFDFTPTVNSIQFEYVFASEEYCDWVGTVYNDHFGFFISGPGINGPFQFGAKNLALVPGTQEFVAINSINNNNNSNYFNGNSNSCNNTSVMDYLEFDGFTDILTASVNVIPCETYTIRLVISDFVDENLDSGVFLKANSFNLGGNALVGGFTPNNQGVSYEGCFSSSFIFERAPGSDLSQPVTVCYTVGGTAIEGVDYDFLGNCITIPAGDNTYELPVYINYDSISEGQESIILQLDLPCSCIDPTAEIIILDASPLEINADDLVICENDIGIISPLVSGGSGSLQYEWSTGVSTLEITVPALSTDYLLTVTDECGNSEVITINVFAAPLPQIILDTLSDVSCFQAADGNVYIYPQSGTSPFSYSWSNGSNAAYVENLSGGNYTLTLTDFYGCQDIQSFSIYEPPLLEAHLSINHVLCFGENNGAILVDSIFGGTPSYNLFFDDISVSSDFEYVNLIAGIYYVDIIDDNGCELNFELEINEPPLLTVEIDGDSIILLGCPVELNTNPTNPYPSNLEYHWTPVECNGCLEFSDLPYNETVYSVQVTDENNCTASDIFKVYVQKPRNIFIPNVFSPNGDGQNDVFLIHGGKDVRQVLNFKIFNRWGGQLFEVKNFHPNDPTLGWDGTVKGDDLSPGVYVYYAHVEFIDGISIIYKGDVTLVR